MKAINEGKRPFGAVLLSACLAFYGAMGVVSGLILIADPSGAGMGFTSDIREEIPFQSFLPVGLFLFTVFGSVPLLLAYGAWTKKELAFEKISEVSGYHWSWAGGMLLVLVLVLWLTVEGTLIGLDYAATYMTVVMGMAVFLALMLPLTEGIIVDLEVHETLKLRSSGPPELVLDYLLAVVQPYDVYEDVLADRYAQGFQSPHDLALGVLVPLALEDVLEGLAVPIDGVLISEHKGISVDVVDRLLGITRSSLYQYPFSAGFFTFDRQRFRVPKVKGVKFIGLTSIHV